MSQLNLLVGAAGGALSATVLLLVFGSSSQTTASAADAGRLDVLDQAVRASRAAGEELTATLQSLVERVARIEVRAARAPVAAPPATSPPEDSAAGSRAAAGKAGAAPELAPAEFRGLLTDVLRSSREGAVAPEDEERFWRAARTTSLVDDTIGALEAAVAAAPGDPESRLALADAYVAKLLTIPGGPERGLWGMKTESQWQKVVESDPDHWEAQFSLAYNYSMYPDFLNKTDAAITGFERALEIQQRSRPSDERAKTYVNLARMYQKTGQAEKAREVLELGQSRHPNHAGIAEALQGLVK